ncbi:nucleoside deaminase [Nocardia arthritidis]|nr:nucleoside deaminase [Nocardia arthritidis]
MGSPNSNKTFSPIRRRTATLALAASATAFIANASNTGSAASICELDEATNTALERLNNYRPTPTELQFHELLMARVIRMAANNPRRPFCATIVDRDGRLMAEGINNSAAHPGKHAEIVAINAYIERHGNNDWSNTTMYTTGEPCAMCLGTIAWARIPRVIWASSVETIRQSGIGQISIGAIELAARAHEIYQPEYLLGGVCADVMDLLFRTRPR